MKIHAPFSFVDAPIQHAIFHSYVTLPEGQPHLIHAASLGGTITRFRTKQLKTSWAPVESWIQKSRSETVAREKLPMAWEEFYPPMKHGDIEDGFYGIGIYAHLRTSTDQIDRSIYKAVTHFCPGFLKISPTNFHPKNSSLL